MRQNDRLATMEWQQKRNIALSQNKDTPMADLHISSNFSIPVDAVTQTFAILAKRGVGKTYCASVLVEELLKAGLHAVVVDPIRRLVGPARLSRWHAPRPADRDPRRRPRRHTAGCRCRPADRRSDR